VERVLKGHDAWPGHGRRVLDVGCGTGDFARAFAADGASVVAVDLSPRAIEEARRRSCGLPTIEYRVGGIETLALTAASVDLATSITVLQHLDDDGLQTALSGLSGAVKPGGHALALEIAPATPSRDNRSPHVHVRSRDQWVRGFAAHAFDLRAEVAYPQLAVLLLNRIGRARAAASRAQGAGGSRRRLRRLAYRMVLGASWVFDHGLALPAPAGLALYRIFLFRRL